MELVETANIIWFQHMSALPIDYTKMSLLHFCVKIALVMCKKSERILSRVFYCLFYSHKKYRDHMLSYSGFRQCVRKCAINDRVDKSAI